MNWQQGSLRVLKKVLPYCAVPACLWHSISVDALAAILVEGFFSHILTDIMKRREVNNHERL